MDFAQIVKLIIDSGVGIASFAALLFGCYKLLVWLDEVKSNHLPHLNEGIVKLNEKTDKTNELLQKLVDK